MSTSYKVSSSKVLPYHYIINFDTNFKTFKFDGKEVIFALVDPNTTKITLNAKELKILKAEIENRSKRQKAIVIYDKKKEKITLQIKKPVSGICKIYINFRGINNDKMYGFYRASYKTGNKKKYLLTTQFESTSARAAFPCFDDPSIKATFSISITTNKKYKVISNMPIKRSKSIKNRKKVTFFTTPKMSTYLVYVGVGEFKTYSENYKGMKIRIITTPKKKPYGKLAVNFTKKFLSFYENYFGIRYMLPKLDLIAIPDFAAGAMENWGAITFREVDLLADIKKSSAATKQNVAETIAHELAHQWFGDLVTMKWWDDLWLNESFATFMSFKAINSVFPKWKYMTQYLNEVVSVALSADELRATHPINVKVRNPAEIEEVFDRISYEKGSSVLSMIEDFVGEETFRKGLHIYLDKHMYGNATKYDLWDAIGLQMKREGRRDNLKDIASFWIDNPGYPIINVSKTKTGFEIKQERFLITSKHTNTKSKPAPIPIHYITSKGSEGFVLFNSKKSIIKNKNAKWIKINYGQHGFYRASYSEEILSSIGKAIKSKKLPDVDVWGIQNDLFELTRKGSIKAAYFIDFVRKYLIEYNYPTNTNLSMHLNWLYMMLYNTNMYGKITELIYKFSSYWLNKLGWRKKKTDTNLDIFMRSLAVSNLGIAGDKNTINKAKRMFEKGPKTIDPDLRSTVYKLIAWSGGKKEFNKLLKLYKKETVPEEKIRLLRSLAFFKDQKLVKQALNFSYSKYVRLQDSVFIPIIVATNPARKHEYWPWLKSQWKLMMKRYPEGTGIGGMLSRLVEATSTCSTVEEFLEIKRFFSKKSNTREDIKRSILQAQERIEANIKFKKENINQ